MVEEFEKLPSRIFLDTNLVCFIFEYAEEIFDGIQCSPKTKPRILADIEALYNMFFTGKRASWQLAISPNTYQEIISTRDLDKKNKLDNWFFELWYYWRSIVEESSDLPSFLEFENMRVNLLSFDEISLLPDASDRMLLIDAIAYNCDVFCTRDWRTILSIRYKLDQLPIRILTPSEWWQIVQPYSNLWV